MGLIREPKNVDFYVLDMPWTDKERKEFSEFIRLRKEKQKQKKRSICHPTMLLQENCFEKLSPSC